MTVTAASFRQHWPEFTSTTDYPDPQVNFWISLAGKMLFEDVWGEVLDNGIELFVAHHLVMWKRSATGGSIPGNVTGVVSGKSVGPVSVSYDVGSVSFTDAGHWNASTYGQQIWFLIQMFGAGGLQL